MEEEDVEDPLTRKDCSRVYYDYDDQVLGEELLVTSLCTRRKMEVR